MFSKYNSPKTPAKKKNNKEDEGEQRPYFSRNAPLKGPDPEFKRKQSNISVVLLDSLDRFFNTVTMRITDSLRESNQILETGMRSLNINTVSGIRNLTLLANSRLLNAAYLRDASPKDTPLSESGCDLFDMANNNGTLAQLKTAWEGLILASGQEILIPPELPSISCHRDGCSIKDLVDSTFGRYINMYTIEMKIRLNIITSSHRDAEMKNKILETEFEKKNTKFKEAEKKFNDTENATKQAQHAVHEAEKETENALNAFLKATTDPKIETRSNTVLWRKHILDNQEVELSNQQKSFAEKFRKAQEAFTIAKDAEAKAARAQQEAQSARNVALEHKCEIENIQKGISQKLPNVGFILVCCERHHFELKNQPFVNIHMTHEMPIYINRVRHMAYINLVLNERYIVPIEHDNSL